MHTVPLTSLPTPDASHVRYAVNRLVEAFNPLKIFVFGSYARGEAGPGSDLDLLVVMPGPENKRETAIAMRRVLKDMPIPKDIVVATPEDLIRRKDAFWHVIGLAQKEGQVVYRVGGDGV